MSRSAVARTYAETLLELAEREQAGEAWLGMLDEIVSLFRTSGEFRAFLDTPRIATDEKRRTLREALAGRYPEAFVRFLLVVLDKRRQGALSEIEKAYRDLLDEKAGRVHATVTLAVAPDPGFGREIEAALSRTLGREVAAEFRQDERLLGGVTVRVEDLVLDGSLRRRLQLLRRSLIEAAGPGGEATGPRPKRAN